MKSHPPLTGVRSQGRGVAEVGGEGVVFYLPVRLHARYV